MSLVAKVFVVLNLLVSVAFLIFSMNVWTAQTKWQKMYEEEKVKSVAAFAAAQKPIVELSKSHVLQEQLVQAEKTRNNEMKLKLDQSRDQKITAETELAVERNKLTMLQAENQEVNRELKRVYEDLTKLKGVVIKQQQAVAVERDNAQRARNQASEMEAELNVTKQTLAAINRDKTQIENDLALAQNRIDGLLRAGVDIQRILGESPSAYQPQIDAQVLAVRADVGLVMLSAGSQQGVKPGFQLTVSRGADYIAKVQVDRVYPDMSSAKVIPGLTKQGAEIQVHDEAKSRP